MVKGLISLFTSGAIFNPMVLLGVVLGVYCMTALETEQITLLFKDYRLYVGALLVSFLYTFFFKKVYQENGDDLDLITMIFYALWGVVKFTLSAILMISFIIIIGF